MKACSGLLESLAFENVTDLVESQNRDSDLRRLLPAILNSFGVTIEERLELVVGRFLVQVVPFLCGMYSEPTLQSMSDLERARVLARPFLFGGQFLITTE